uniref:Uncharacterized protein n=1 Tax=Ixodes ricinus TaxID=34613 RepID=A0A6B0V344_IXORI
MAGFVVIFILFVTTILLLALLIVHVLVGVVTLVRIRGRVFVCRRLRNNASLVSRTVSVFAVVVASFSFTRRSLALCGILVRGFGKAEVDGHGTPTYVTCIQTVDGFDCALGLRKLDECEAAHLSVGFLGNAHLNEVAVLAETVAQHVLVGFERQVANNETWLTFFPGESLFLGCFRPGCRLLGRSRATQGFGSG